MYGVIKILGVGTFFYVFEISSSYVPRLHLFVQKYSKNSNNAKYYYTRK